MTGYLMDADGGMQKQNPGIATGVCPEKNNLTPSFSQAEGIKASLPVTSLICRIC